LNAATGLPDLLLAHRGRIETMVRFEARGLLRFETEEDLVQGILARALERGTSFAYRDDPSFFSWIRRTAESYLADRRAHWGALKRRAGRVLRLTQGGGGEPAPGSALEPPSDATGPSTIASRREQIGLVMKALDLLLPKDRDLVRWSADGVDVEETARRLGIGYEAAGKARQRALDRFRKSFELVSGGR
jgi:DNA-directed RNA polymerase specialized sigma24 family protein